MPITINNKFTPFTFEELIAPEVMYTQEMDRMQDAYVKLLEDARTMEDLKDIPMDSEVYNSYMDWKNRVKQQSDNIANGGMNPMTRRELNKLRREYAEKFAGYEDKIAKRAELIKDQRTLNKSGNYVFDTDYSTTSIDRVSSNSTFTPYDLDKITKETTESVYNQLLANPNAAPSIDDIITSHGVDKIKDENVQNKVLQSIRNGVIAGAGNYRAYADKLALDEYKATHTASGRARTSTTGGAITRQSFNFTKADAEKLLNNTSIKNPLTDTALTIAHDKTSDIYTLTDISGATKKVIDFSEYKKAVAEGQGEKESDEDYKNRLAKAYTDAIFKTYYTGTPETYNTFGREGIIIKRDNGYYMVNPNAKSGESKLMYIGNKEGKTFNRQFIATLEGKKPSDYSVLLDGDTDTIVLTSSNVAASQPEDFNKKGKGEISTTIIDGSNINNVSDDIINKIINAVFSLSDGRDPGLNSQLQLSGLPENIIDDRNKLANFLGNDFTISVEINKKGYYRVVFSPVKGRTTSSTPPPTPPTPKKEGEVEYDGTAVIND